VTKTNPTYEAVYRLATALYEEWEISGREGYITYRELSHILNRFGYEKQAGGEYTETNGKALGQMASAVWWYVHDKYGEEEARKVYWTIRDEQGKCREDQTDRRARSRE
jgi:hypothetical protein